jgi:hypothetical protein
MLAPFTSMHLESELSRFGNPLRFAQLRNRSSASPDELELGRDPRHWFGVRREIAQPGKAVGSIDVANPPLLAEHGCEIVGVQRDVALCGGFTADVEGGRHLDHALKLGGAGDVAAHSSPGYQHFNGEDFGLCGLYCSGSGYGR